MKHRIRVLLFHFNFKKGLLLKMIILSCIFIVQFIADSVKMCSIASLFVGLNGLFRCKEIR